MVEIQASVEAGVWRVTLDMPGDSEHLITGHLEAVMHDFKTGARTRMIDVRSAGLDIQVGVPITRPFAAVAAETVVVTGVGEVSVDTVMKAAALFILKWAKEDALANTAARLQYQREHGLLPPTPEPKPEPTQALRTSRQRGR